MLVAPVFRFWSGPSIERPLEPATLASRVAGVGDPCAPLRRPWRPVLGVDVGPLSALLVASQGGLLHLCPSASFVSEVLFATADPVVDDLWAGDWEADDLLQAVAALLPRSN
ncbi:hypothetical protein [Acuticoccus sp.]|uniref:hypothetical protein n=1 Tax=Acuticoccus sp. TaxID=1904378 RepID=UPI003B52A40D